MWFMCLGMTAPDRLLLSYSGQHSVNGTSSDASIMLNICAIMLKTDIHALLSNTKSVVCAVVVKPAWTGYANCYRSPAAPMADLEGIPRRTN